MLRHGIPRDVVTALRSMSRSFRAWGGSTKVTRPLRDGERARLRRPHAARCCTARVTPRLTRCFHDRERRER